MNKKGWLVYEEEHAKKNKAFIDWFLDESKLLSVDLTLLLQSQLSFGVKNNSLILYCDGKEVTVPDFVIMRNRDPLFSEQLEHLNIPCFNSSRISFICNDKARTHQFLARMGIPMLDTFFVTKKDLGNDRLPLPFPFVVKSRFGRGGDEVYMVENEEQLAETHHHLSADSLILQPLAGSPGKDLRVYVLGKKIVGAVLRSNDSQFKANYSLGGTAKAYSLNPMEQQLVERVIAPFDFGLVGIDFLFDEHGNLLLNEIEDVVGCRTLCLTSDINIVKLYLQYILNKLSEGEGGR